MFGLKKLASVFAFLFAWLAFLPSCFAATAILPAPTQDIYLVDDAFMVNEEDKAQILNLGRELDQKTGAQVVVVTMNTLGPESIEDYANKLFRKWGIGDKKKNNGVLLLIAKEDRKFRVEVGYGLEGAITDGYSGSVLDGMKAGFRKEEYSPAILAAYGKLVQKAYEAENMAPPEAVGAAAAASNATSPDNASEEEEDWAWWEIVLGIGIALVFIGLLFWCFAQLLVIAWGLLTLLLYLLTSGAIDLTDKIPSFGGGGGHSGGGGWGGGSSGGSSGGGFGGGSSGGGGSSSGW